MTPKAGSGKPAQGLRSDKGLRSTAILRILEACTRSMLLYGLEFWGSNETLTQKADAFIFAAIRTLFDLPIATPHRAISSEFSIVPTSIRYNYIIRRIASRRLTFDPQAWLDNTLPSGHTRSLIRSSLDNVFEDTIVSWKNETPLNDFKNVFLCQDEPGDVVISKIFQDGDLIVCTDGSFANDRLGFSFCVSDKKDFSSVIMDYHALLTPRKTILDAEATALVCGLDAALTLPHTGGIFLLSDCRPALRLFLDTSPSGPLNYLNTPLSKLAKSPRKIYTAWIKGHAGHPGNERADQLAKTASTLNDPFPGTTHSYLTLHLSTAISTEWLAWFSNVAHEYTRPPRRHIKIHRSLTRLESSVLFRLRSNKGWTPGDNIGTSTPPPCPCDGTTPRDGTHLLTCPTSSRMRPPDITDWVHLDHRRTSVLKWATHHKLFGILLRKSPVKWISLSRPGNISAPSRHTCNICTRTFTNKSHLSRHQRNIHPDRSSTLFIIGTPQNCTRCTACFDNKTDLDRHTATTHSCPDCRKIFTDIANMYRHMIKTHGGLLCAGCSRRYPSRITLRMHQRSNCRGSRS